jgi:hypothetical protein
MGIPIEQLKAEVWELRAESSIPLGVVGSKILPVAAFGRRLPLCLGLAALSSLILNASLVAKPFLLSKSESYKDGIIPFTS